MRLQAVFFFIEKVIVKFPHPISSFRIIQDYIKAESAASNKENKVIGKLCNNTQVYKCVYYRLIACPVSTIPQVCVQMYII